MRLVRWLILLAPLAAAGCGAFGDDPPADRTALAPPLVCTTGNPPPC